MTNILNLLQALDITVWVPQSSDSYWLKQARNPQYIFMLDPKEWTDAKAHALCIKIIEALKWPIESVGVIDKSASIEELSGAKIVAFGYLSDNLVFRLKPIVVPTLTEMLQSVEAKRKAWTLLKGIQK